MMDENKLKRRFGLWTAIALIIGQVIAVGIFLTPAGMAKTVGSPLWLLVIWLVMGGMTLCGALCYGELAARFPEAGGSYIYLRESFGRLFAFLYGWMVLLVLDPGLTAIFGVGFVAYLNYLVPLSPAGKQLLAVAVICAMALINILGVKIGTNVLKVLTILKIGTLFFIIIYGFAGGLGSWENMKPLTASPADPFAASAAGLVSAFFAFAGWWEVSRAAGEIKEPKKNLPLALTISVIFLTLTYILTSGVFLYLVPLVKVTSDETFAAQAGEVLFGAKGGAIFALIVMISVAGTLAAYLMAAPRVYYAMARDGLFFESIGRLHPRFGTPHYATIIQVLLASILVVSGTFEQILSYFFFIVVCFLGLTVAGLFKIRKQAFDGYKTPLFPLPPIIFLGLTMIILFLIAAHNPLQTSVGTAVVFAGIPVYYLFFKRKRDYADGLDQNNQIQ